MTRPGVAVDDGTTIAPVRSDPWVYPEVVTAERQSKHRLAATIREVVSRVALLDSGAATLDALDAAQQAAEQLDGLLAGLPSLQDASGAIGYGPDDSPLVERGPISGLSSPLAPPVVMEYTGGDIVRATATFGRVHEGPAGMVHGGVLLLVFDEVLAFGQVPSGVVGMTGTITVKLLGSVPINTPITFEAGTDRIEGRKVMVWARALVGTSVAAEATAICITVRT